MKTRFLKIRMPNNTYQRLKERAGEAGRPISTFANDLLEKEDSIVNTTLQLVEIKSQLQEVAVLLAITSQSDIKQEKPNLVMSEVLYIVRELALDRNAQILNKVALQINDLSKGI